MPSYGNFILDKGYDADAAISKGRAVKVGTSAESVTPVTAEGDMVLGIAVFAVSAAEILKGKGASVRRDGIAEMETGAAVTRGDSAAIDASGRVVAANTGARVIGLIEQTADAAGKFVAVSLNLPSATVSA